MTFNLKTRTRKVVSTLLAVGVLGGTGTAVAVSQSTASKVTTGATAAKVANATPVAAAKSTVPKPLTRAETAAEDVIGFLEAGQPAKSKAEARILRSLAHGQAAGVLRQAGVPKAKINALQQRADRTAKLSLAGARPLRVSLAANSVSQLMPGFYARYQDPVPASVLKLDYLDREVQLRSQAGEKAKVRKAVRQLDTTWRQLRLQLIRAGGSQVVNAYDQHVSALKGGSKATAIQKEAVKGLDLVDKMEGVFLGK